MNEMNKIFTKYKIKYTNKATKQNSSKKKELKSVNKLSPTLRVTITH